MAGCLKSGLFYPEVWPFSPWSESKTSLKPWSKSTKNQHWVSRKWIGTYQPKFMHICVVRVSMFWHSQISILQLSSKTQIIWPIHQKCIQNLYTSNGTAAQGENFEMDLIKEDQIKMPTPRFFYSSEEDFTPNHFLEKTNSHPSAFRLQPDPPIWTQNYISVLLST